MGGRERVFKLCAPLRKVVVPLDHRFGMLKDVGQTGPTRDVVSPTASSASISAVRCV